MYILDTTNFSLEKRNITNITNSNLPTLRIHYGATLLPNNKIIYIGGYDGKNYLTLEQVYIYDTISNNWYREITTGIIPSNRGKLSAVLGLDGQKVIIFGGSNNSNLKSNESLYVLNLTNFEWYIPRISGKIPKNRYYHKANVIDNYMIISFGRGYNQSIESDILLLDISNNEEYVWKWLEISQSIDLLTDSLIDSLIDQFNLIELTKTILIITFIIITPIFYFKKKKNNNSNWLEEAISNNYIKYYEYKHFSNIQKIGTGYFGEVFRANYKDSEQYLALKSFFNLDIATIKEIIHELKLQREVDFHNNVIRFHGIANSESENLENQRSMNILQGLRETPILEPDIPSDYIKLYIACWDGEPNKRPTIKQVTSQLKAMLSQIDEKDNSIVNLNEDDNNYPVKNLTRLSQLLNSDDRNEVSDFFGFNDLTNELKEYFEKNEKNN
ncbi:unnamed protein product [Rhizophagus irregularis]|nr:unnamed protein product [Rhizophagus irregularis]